MRTSKTGWRGAPTGQIAGAHGFWATVDGGIGAATDAGAARRIAVGSDRVYLGSNGLHRFDLDGTWQWTRGQSTGPTTTWVPAIGSSSQCIAVGMGTPYVFKFDGTGNFIWRKRLTCDSAVDIELQDVAVDSSGNIIVCGAKASSPTRGLVAALDSSGGLLWHAFCENNDYDITRFVSVAVDSSGDVYASGYGSRAVIAKISGGSLIWCYRHFTTTTGTYGGSVTIDSADNVFWGAQSPAALYALDGDANVNWWIKNSLISPGSLYVSGDFLYGVNSILVGSESTANGYLWKRSLASGSRKFLRQVSIATSTLTHGIGVDATGQMWIVGNTSTKMTIGNVPISGAGMRNYSGTPSASYGYLEDADVIDDPAPFYSYATTLSTSDGVTVNVDTTSMSTDTPTVTINRF